MDVDTLPNHVNLYILLFSFFGFYHNCCTNHNITKFLLDILSDLPYMTKIPKPFLSKMVSFCTFICILDNSRHKLGTSLVCSGWYSQVVQTFISYRVTPQTRGSVDYPSTRGIQVDVRLPDVPSENRAESPLYGELYPITTHA